MEHPTQILFILNVDGDVSESEVLPLLTPNRYELLPFRLSDFGAVAVLREGGKRLPVDWDGHADAIERMISVARDKNRELGRPAEFYATGLAPLPLFAHLGCELSAWAAPLVLLNRRKAEQWDVLPLVGSEVGKSGQVFDVMEGLSTGGPAVGTGHVALFVSTIGQPAPQDAIRTALREDGKGLAGVVEIRTSSLRYLDSTNSANASEQLTMFLSQIAGAYPHAAGVAVFIAGPAPLAHIVGRAINPNQFAEILFAYYEAPRYEIVLRRPRPGRRVRPISMEQSDKLVRTSVLEEMKKGIEDIRVTVQAEDLPEFMGSEGKSQFLNNLQRVALPSCPEGESFELHMLQGRMILGHGLLEALRDCSLESVRRIAALFFLHEVYHFDQNLQSTNYLNIGRAGVVLEELDFWADAVAVCAMTRRDIRLSQPDDRDAASRCLSTNVEGVLSGIEAFDRFEHGDRIDRLAERRLRRYLIWHLQLARARTRLGTGEEVQRMLTERLIVELAPLVGPVDVRSEKIVSRPLPTTELYVVLGKRLFRFPPNAYVDPGVIIESVRSFARETLASTMDYVVGQHGQDFAPWVLKTR
ncbi:hypothetical protein [Nitrospira lenta]|uniref:SMODS-associated and fused to various effectors domain-containing protein n=1 Tax=Nitrospira lenta TaxID=1436998 RepID=A0A330L2T3_9BACT|nr:hypothetical protein [Nitrospira lenta]SPP63954.1 hypothetical protein NITLEN_11040 [Nitrospira lenta]